MSLVSYLFILLFVFFVAFSIYTGEEMEWSNAGILIFALVYLFLLPFLLKRNAKKTYDTNKILQEPITFTIDDKEIQMNAESYRSQMAWDKVFKVIEDDNSIYIFHSKQTANLLPKRDLSNQQLTDLKNIIRTKKGFSRKLQD